MTKRPLGDGPVNVIVVGVGHLGRAHARVYSELENVRLVGVVDRDPDQARTIGEQFGVPHYLEVTEELLEEVHAASVVTPTPTHFDVASHLVRAGVAVLVEKPMCSTLAQAQELHSLADLGEVTLQVGHIERFNPVIVAALPHIQDPVFLECERIHPFSFRSVETSVVLDLMIHDIDNVLNLADSPVAQLDAFGTPVLSATEDLAYARMTFENGCTAVVKASRVAIQKSRKMRIFSDSSYVSLDFIGKTGMRMTPKEGFDRTTIDFQKMASLEETHGVFPLFTQYFNIEQLSVADEEPLKAELEAFLLAVRSGREPAVTGEQGVQAIDIATRIRSLIAEHNEFFLKGRARLERKQ